MQGTGLFPGVGAGDREGSGCARRCWWAHAQASLCPGHQEDCTSQPSHHWGGWHVPGSGRSVSPRDMGNCQAESVKGR